MVIVQTPHEKDKFFVPVQVVQKNISRKERREENAFIFYLLSSFPTRFCFGIT